ncbi:adenylyl-sulfate kinase [Streptomyces pratensis]|uniref:adenylyl-sulfate kinase n=1 Tax=Streptomyces pratensis TaxID=1169025 RepID=UPI003015E835
MTSHRPFCTCWPGATVWLTGAPGAGKTTVVTGLARRLEAAGRRVHVLDGDEQHALFGTGPAPGRVRCATDVHRVGLVAEVLARNGVLALVPVAVADAKQAEGVRRRHTRSATTCLEVYVDAGPEGADVPSPAPDRRDLTLPAYRLSVEESVTELVNLLKQRELA